jgi:glycosyltransferase involved in cell wall biosynthesis
MDQKTYHVAMCPSRANPPSTPSDWPFYDVKMKLVHIFPNHSWGGAEIYMLQLASWQSSQGLDVTVWCKQDTPIHQDAVKRGLKIILDEVPLRKPLWHLSRLAKIIKKESFTHLQIHWSGGVMTFAGIKWFCDVKVYYHTHMFMTYPKKDPFHWFAYRQLDRIFMAGERAKKQHLRTLPIKESQIKIIPYGLDLSEAKKFRGLKDYKKWNLQDGPFYAGFFGRLDRQKGTKEFLQAAIPLLEKYPRLHLLVVGDATKGEEDALAYEKEIEALIHHPKIHRITHQKEFLSLMACSDVIVMPSYQETYSILIINSFALGIPVLSTNDGGTPDLIGEKEERGWLVPPRVVEPLGEKLEKILMNPEAAKEKSVACISYVEKFHDHQKVAEMYFSEY